MFLGGDLGLAEWSFDRSALPALPALPRGPSGALAGRVARGLRRCWGRYVKRRVFV